METPNTENANDIIPSNWIVVTNNEGEVVFNGNNIILQHKFNDDTVGYVENTEQNRAIFGIQAEEEDIEQDTMDGNMTKTLTIKQDQDILDENEATTLTINSVSEGWSHNTIKQLLALYEERKDRFRNPQIKKKVLWREIGKVLNKSLDECDKKFRNLKITYKKLLKKKKSSGRQAITWIYFEALDDIFRNDINANPELSLNVMGTLPVLLHSDSEHCSSHSITDGGSSTSSLTISRPNMPSTSSSDSSGKMKNIYVQTKQKNHTEVENSEHIQNKQETQATQNLGNASQQEPPKKKGQKKSGY